MGICSRCGTETGGAKYCPECGLPQSLQGPASSAEPGAFVPLSIDKKAVKARKKKAAATGVAAPPAAAPKKPQPPKAAPAPKPAPKAAPAPAEPVSVEGTPKGRVALVVVLCLVAAMAIVVAVFALRNYGGGQPQTQDAAGTAASAQTQARSSSLSATARAAARAKLATAEEKEALQAAIADAAALNGDDYTVETYEALTEAIAQGRSTASDEAALDRDVRSAAKRIETALSSLKERVKPVAYSGTGSTVLEIPADLASSIVVATHKGQNRFVIDTVGEDGNIIDTLVDATGPYSGTTANGKLLGTPKRISILTDGEWTLNLASMSDAPTLSSGQQVIGDAVVRIDPQRAAFLTFTNVGEGNFVVYGMKGASSNLIVNEIGPYTGSVPNSGYRMLAVKSNGTWSVSW